DLTGHPTPPWKLCYVFYLVNVTTGRLHTFAHDTYGTLLCYEAIKEQCFVKQWLTGTFVMPIVRLEKAPWKSAKYGMQLRPHFEPSEWREPPRASGGNAVQQASTPQLSGPAPAPTANEPPPWEAPAPASASAYPPKTPPTAAQAAAAIAAKAP